MDLGHSIDREQSPDAQLPAGAAVGGDGVEHLGLVVPGERLPGGVRHHHDGTGRIDGRGHPAVGLLGGGPVGDVAPGDQEGADRRLVAEVGDPDVEDPPAAVGVAKAVVTLEVGGGAPGEVPEPAGTSEVVGVHDLADGHAEHLVGVTSEQATHPGPGPQQPPVGAHQGHELVAVGAEGAKAGLVGREVRSGLLGGDPLADVADGDDHGPDLGVVEQVVGAGLEVPHGAVGLAPGAQHGRAGARHAEDVPPPALEIGLVLGVGDLGEGEAHEGLGGQADEVLDGSVDPQQAPVLVEDLDEVAGLGQHRLEPTSPVALGADAARAPDAHEDPFEAFDLEQVGADDLEGQVLAGVVPDPGGHAERGRQVAGRGVGQVAGRPFEVVGVHEPERAVSHQLVEVEAEGVDEPFVGQQDRAVRVDEERGQGCPGEEPLGLRSVRPHGPEANPGADPGGSGGPPQVAPRSVPHAAPRSPAVVGVGRGPRGPRGADHGTAASGEADGGGCRPRWDRARRPVRRSRPGRRRAGRGRHLDHRAGDHRRRRRGRRGGLRAPRPRRSRPGGRGRGARHGGRGAP